MADVRVTQLPAASSLQNTDILHGIQTADGRDKKFTLLDLLGYMNAAGVNSVFGRQGDVIAVEGDYSLDLMGDVDLTTTAPTTGQYLVFNGANWVPENVPTSPVGGMAMHYKWSTNTLSTDPGAGYVKVNNADPHLATQLYINDLTSLGNDLSPVYDNIEAGDVIGVWEEAASNTTLYYEVTSATDNSGWHTFGVTNIPTAAGTINNNNHVQVFVVGNPDRQLIPGGTAGQLLTKVDGTNYNVQWADPAVQSVHGRTGAVVAVDGDYSLAQLSDVNATTFPPTTGDILKFGGTFWEPVADSTGTVTSVASGTGLTGGPITTTGTLSVNRTTVDTWYAPAAHVGAGGTAHPAATTTTAGFMSAADKTKVDGIAAGAQPGTVTNLATGTGLTGGPITTTGTVSLANTAVTPGSYTLASITVDQQGRVTAASSGSAGTGTVTNVTGTAPIVITGTSTTTPNVTVTAATTSAAGVMSAADKTKLDGIAAGAEVNVPTNLTYTTAATTGTVNSSTGTNATIPAATTSLAGLMTNADKTKLNGIATGATANTGTVTSVAGTAPIVITGTATTTPTVTVTAASTTASGVVQLNNTHTSTSTTQALTAAEGKVIWDRAETKLPLAGGTMTGAVSQTVRAIANNTAWDMNTANLWTFAGGTVANPANATAGKTGVIRIDAAVAGWGGNFRHPGATPLAPTAFPAVVPYYVAANNVVLLGSPVEGIA